MGLKNSFPVLLFLFFFAGPILSQENPQSEAYHYLETRGEVIIKFARENLDPERITRMVSIDKVTHDSITAYANAKEFREFLKLGLDYSIITPASLNKIHTKEFPLKSTGARSEYPMYNSYLSFMEECADLYPDICRMDTIGTTTNGRLLLALKISDNVGQDEAEPEFLFTSTIHGDELTGYILLLDLIDDLLTKYDKDPQIRDLVDTVEIWINPCANPDGTYKGGDETVDGATRYNANNVDLNRNFPDPVGGDHPDGEPWQPETRAMMDFMQTHHFVLSANYHGGAEVMNYPWDDISDPHADEDWFIYISSCYADTVKKYGGSDYFSNVDPSGIINGYDWYSIYGGRQDYTTYYTRGREITIEVSIPKIPDPLNLPDYWDYNRIAMLEYIRQCSYGIHGRVYDAETGDPLAAKLVVSSHDRNNSSVFSDSLIGDFHRLLAPGTYGLVFSKEGYYSNTQSATLSDHHSSLWLEVAMQPVRDQQDPFRSNSSLRWMPSLHSFRFESSVPGYYTLFVYDVQGRLQWKLDRQSVSGGVQIIEMNKKIPAGIYIAKLQVNGISQENLPFLVSD